MQEEQVGELFAQTSMAWSRGFRAEFPRLRELDLRACKIQVIGEEVFKGMSNLKALYLGENKVLYINPAAFVGLRNLLHLDISKNTVMNNGEVQSLTMESYNLFEPLVNLLSLDMSFTKLTDRHVAMIKSVGPKLRRLSLCDTGLTNFPDGVFNRTSLRILDLSTNYGIFSGTRTLMGLENTLQTLYAKDTGLRTLEVVKDFKQLKILDVSYNEITNISPNVAKTLSNLHILNLDTNRIAAWFEPTLSYIPSLEILSIKENNINIISDEMIEDITDIKYIAMAANFFVCTCLCRDFFDVAVRNERNEIPQLDIYQKVSRKPISDFHIGYIEYKDLIRRRNTVRSNHTEEYDDSNEDRHGKYLLLDFHPSAYTCILTNEKKKIEFEEAKGCNRMEREMKYANVMQTNKIKMYALISLPGFTIMLMALYIFRRNLKYFVITLRNSAMLSLVHKHEVINDGTIFHYDVFVSYCNEDRGWVLDQLLPQLEADCNISTCLHERDFQVGYSILENIVSCMDRSRSIMLIISQRFLLSQWCQFEMHLAQHRLLETRREDLTLVLLEDIPRRLRPNTLHYLMLTKTYIVWPKDEKERAVFWRRIKKTLVTLKQRQIDAGVSLA